MRVTQAFLAALSVAASQAVIITNTAADFTGITVGVPVVITFAEAVGPTKLFLATGTPENVIEGDAIGTASGMSGSITWTPTTGGLFAFKIVDSGAATSATNPNFSGFFSVAGPSTPTTSSTSSVTSTTMATMTMTMSSTMSYPTPEAPMSTGTAMMPPKVTPFVNGTASPTGSIPNPPAGAGSPPVAPIYHGMATNLASPLALVFLALGALVAIN